MISALAVSRLTNCTLIDLRSDIVNIEDSKKNYPNNTHL